MQTDWHSLTLTHSHLLKRTGWSLQMQIDLSLLKPIRWSLLRLIDWHSPMRTHLRLLKLTGSRWLKQIHWRSMMQIDSNLQILTHLHSLKLTD